MSAKKQTHPKKARLRPARDVLSRLRWSPPVVGPEGTQDSSADRARIVFGYADRIRGTMEKPVEDYVPMNEGGDIPEHRILYFRRVLDDDGHYGDNDSNNNNNNDHVARLSRSVLWDRAGRIDRIFGSGRGRDEEASMETLREVAAAIGNMRQLEEERAERRATRALVRARRARARAAAAGRGAEAMATVMAVALGSESVGGSGAGGGRFRWQSVPVHRFDEEEGRWMPTARAQARADACDPNEEGAPLSVLTWNVLSDVYPGLDASDDSADEGHVARWSLLLRSIRGVSPDVVALQEATPNFARLLSDCEFVREAYASSVMPDDVSTVDPIGQVLLWKRSRVACVGLRACVDGGRRRALAATLRLHDGEVICVANVHLPSDRPGEKAGERISRSLARRRELSAAVGHLQRTETRLGRAEPGTATSHLIVGDFNSPPSELEDGSFAGENGYFCDVWSKVRGGQHEEEGLTFCPETNPRAAANAIATSGSTKGRRIDRMYLDVDSAARWDCAGIEVVRGMPDDRNDGESDDEVTPSDHYGVLARFRTQKCNPAYNIPFKNTSAANMTRLVRPDKVRGALRDASRRRDAWAATAPPSKHYLAAVLLDVEAMERIKVVHDLDSSLPTPHVTLLSGFAELHRGALGMAKDAARDAVDEALADQSGQYRTGEDPTISFGVDGTLDVFEHRESATLVARPSEGDEGNRWLTRLHRALRLRFRLCDEQNSRWAQGFRPHVSLGKFGSASAARSAAAEHANSISSLEVPVRSVDILERGPGGKFRSIATVPLARRTGGRPTAGLRDVVSDAGRAASAAFAEKARIVLSIVGRASRAAARSLPDARMSAEVVSYGSVALGCALPKTSDLDALVLLRPGREAAIGKGEESRVDALEFLKRLMTCLGGLHATKQMRLRQLRSRGLTVLSIQMQSDLPSTDILVCRLGSDDKPLCSEEGSGFDSITDNAHIKGALTNLEGQIEGMGESFSLQDVLCGSLRLIKLWAWNRGIYGAKCGFLGGGAWAIFLARVLEGMLVSAKSGKGAPFAMAKTLPEAAHSLTLAFFHEASCWPWPQPVSLSGSNVDDLCTQTQLRLVVLSPSSADNLAMNSTQSTCLSTAEELRRATKLATGATDPACALERIIAPVKLQELVGSSPEVIVLEIFYDRKSQPSGHLPEDIEAWGCGQYLSFLVHLEKKLDDSSLLRPYCRAFRPLNTALDITVNPSGTHHQDGFVWIVGINGVLPKSERQKVEDIATSCPLENVGDQGVVLSMRVLPSDDAIEKFSSR